MPWWGGGEDRQTDIEILWCMVRRGKGDTDRRIERETERDRRREMRRLSLSRGERQRQRKAETDRRKMGKASRMHLHFLNR